MNRRAPVAFAAFSLIALILAASSVAAQEAAPAPCADCTPPLSADAIAAYPQPGVTQLYASEELLSDRWYERVSRTVDIYDAPNGNITGTLNAGFNFVTGQGTQDTWTQINPDEWVQSDALATVIPSTYAGVEIPGELPYRFGWALVNVVPSRTPGAEPLDEDINTIKLRYTLVNLYAATEVDGWEWYQVGVDQWVEQTNIARYLPVERPAEVDTQRWVSVDLYEQVAIAYEGSTPVFATLVSSGLADWPTNEGLFHVYVRYPRTIMSGADGQPDFYFLEEVPWTQYFDGDIALHGTYWHDGFGYRHSHGCVNLSIADAHWLYDFLSSEIDLTVSEDLGAAVYVYSSGQYR